jgi:hypothetical protein
MRGVFVVSLQFLAFALNPEGNTLAEEVEECGELSRDLRIE